MARIINNNQLERSRTKCIIGYFAEKPRILDLFSSNFISLAKKLQPHSRKTNVKQRIYDRTANKKNYTLILEYHLQH